MIVAYSLLMVFLQCMRNNILLNLFITINIKSFPHLVLVKPPKEPMEMLSHGLVGTLKGWYETCFLLLGFLVHQSMHPLIN
jgi:hypothetical protein